jgi:hypothetical protein
MNRRYVWSVASGLCVIGACLPAARAQHARKLEGLLNRPASNSPSQTIGGQFTASAARPLESTHGPNVSMFGQRPLPSRASMRSYAYGASLGLGQLGFQSDLADLTGGSALNVVSRAMRTRGAEISAISGLSRAVNINLPLPGELIGGVPALSACAYTPRPATNRFEDLLGLLPATPEGPQRTVPSVAERLDARTSDVAARAASEGAALFKAGTQESPDPETLEYQTCVDCPSKLGNAIQQLRMANDLDSQAGLPSLLIVHAALEQGRPLAASDALVEALRRDPKLLTGAGRTLDRYFGDVEREGDRSDFLAAQMRRYARLGEFNPTSPPAFALQAYCAWRLGDAVSARAALSKLDELMPGVDEADATGLHGFATALRGALP